MRLIENIYGNTKMYVDEEDIRANWIEDRLGTQPEKVSLLKNICLKESVCNFYDLGANYGEFSTSLCANVDKVFAFEPNPSVFNCLQKTSVEFYNNIHPFQKAVDISTSEKDFYFNSRYSGGGRLERWQWQDQRYKQFNESKYYHSTKVSCIRFADFFREHNKNQSCLIKIDIEGLELKIIEDLMLELETLDKWFIYFEANDKRKINFSKLPGKVLIEHPTDILIGKITRLEKGEIK